MTDETARGFELPHPDNIAREDAGRIRRTIEKIDGQMTDLEGREASEAAFGSVRLATAAEATAGTATGRVPTVKRVMDMITSIAEDIADDVADLTDSVATALGTKLSKASNLADLANKSAARTALELGSAALKGIATVAALRAKTGTDLVAVDAAWDAAKWVNLGNMGPGSVTIDCSMGCRFYGVLTGNITVNVINLKDGQPFEFSPIQDSTGGRTVSWSVYFLWPSAAAPEVTTAANNTALVVTGVGHWNGQHVFAAGWKITP